jgi:hypothetical protein
LPLVEIAFVVPQLVSDGIVRSDGVFILFSLTIMATKISNGGLAETAADPRIVPMRVIVCGLMRTGTLSKSSLNPLGFFSPQPLSHCTTWDFL